MRAYLLLLLLLAVLLPGCVTAGATDGAAMGGLDAPSRIYVRDGPPMHVTWSADAPSTTTQILAPVDSVWAALAATYQELGIPVDVADRATLSMGSSGARARRELGGAPLATYLDCGTSIGGINANTHDVTLSLLTRLESLDPLVTQMEIRVQAVARGMGVSSGSIGCTSVGKLEQRITELVGRRAG